LFLDASIISLGLPLKPVTSNFSNSKRLKTLDISSSNSFAVTIIIGTKVFSSSEFDFPSKISTLSVISSIPFLASDKFSDGILPEIILVYFVYCKCAKSISKLFN
jgi:hypothetical protein